MVSSQQQSALLGVPQGKCEHPIESIGAIQSPLFIRVDDDLGVGVRSKLAFQRLEGRKPVYNVAVLGTANGHSYSGLLYRKDLRWLQDQPIRSIERENDSAFLSDS